MRVVKMELPPQELEAIEEMIRCAGFLTQTSKHFKSFFRSLTRLHHRDRFIITLAERNAWFRQEKKKKKKNEDFEEQQTTQEPTTIDKLMREGVLVPVDGATDDTGPFYFSSVVDKAKLTLLGKRGMVFFLHRMGAIKPGQKMALEDKVDRLCDYWRDFSYEWVEAWRVCATLRRDQLIPAELEPEGENYEFPWEKFRQLLRERGLAVTERIEAGGSRGSRGRRGRGRGRGGRGGGSSSSSSLISGRSRLIITPIFISISGSSSSDEDGEFHRCHKRPKPAMDLPAAGYERGAIEAGGCSSSASAMTITATTSSRGQGGNPTTRTTPKRSTIIDGMIMDPIVLDPILIAERRARRRSTIRTTISTTTTAPVAAFTASIGISVHTTPIIVPTTTTPTSPPSTMLEPRTERSHLPDMIWFLGSMAQRSQVFLGDLVFQIFEDRGAFLIVSTRTGVIEAAFVRNGDEWAVKISTEVGNYVEELEGDLEWNLNDCEYCTGGSRLAAQNLLWVALGVAGQLEEAKAAGAFDGSRFYAPCGQEGDSDLGDLVELLGESWGADGDTTSDIESTESTDET